MPSRSRCGLYRACDAIRHDAFTMRTQQKGRSLGRSLPRRGRNAQRALLGYLRLEAEGHAVLLPDERVPREAHGLLEDGAARIAVEEEVRRAFEPVSASPVHRELFD